MKIKKCEQCGKEIDAKSRRHKYCSNGCYNRYLNKFATDNCHILNPTYSHLY